MTINCRRVPGRWFPLALACGLAAPFFAARAAVTTVSIIDNRFNPQTVTINVNDSVGWVWNGLNFHSSTGTNALWDSGVHGNGFAFTNTFNAAGSFPYRCVVHALQTGAVTVQGGNTLPTAAITSPASGSVFSAPWTGTIEAAATDTDGSVTRVDFYTGTTQLGTVSNPGSTISFAVNNLAAGDYVLRAIATDNGGATNTSADVSIRVLTPDPIQLGALAQPAPGSFQFSYSATPGLTYIIEKSDTLGTWMPIGTNTAASILESFTDDQAGAASGFYRVHLAPNP